MKKGYLIAANDTRSLEQIRNDAINEIGNAIINNSISEELINYHVSRVLAWKLYKGMMLDEK